MTELLPCPFCETYEDVTGFSTPEMDGNQNGHWISCIKCLSAGPVSDSPDCATEAWNRRSIDPEDIKETYHSGIVDGAAAAAELNEQLEAEASRLKERVAEMGMALRDVLEFDEWSRSQGGVVPDHLVGVFDRARAALAKGGSDAPN